VPYTKFFFRIPRATFATPPRFVAPRPVLLVEEQLRGVKGLHPFPVLVPCLVFPGLAFPTEVEVPLTGRLQISLFMPHRSIQSRKTHPLMKVSVAIAALTASHRKGLGGSSPSPLKHFVRSWPSIEKKFALTLPANLLSLLTTPALRSFPAFFLQIGLRTELPHLTVFFPPFS